MTIGNFLFLDHLQSNEGNVFPSEQHPDVPEDVATYTNIQLISDDFMVYLRSFYPTQYVDKNGTLRRATTFDTLKRMFKFITDLLAQTDVEVYAICLDPYGNSRPEKRATAKSRVYIPKGEPETLSLPPGQHCFFIYDKEFPAPNMGLIFRTPAARKELYQVISQYLSSEYFRSTIPENKMVVLCGGFGSENLPPLYLGRDFSNMVTELAFPTCSEGDLYAWWVIRHFPGNYMVKSGDADLLFIGLLNMEIILGVDPERKGWFVTPRGAGTVEHDLVDQELKLLAAKKKLYDDAINDGKSVPEAFMISGGMPSERSVKRQHTNDEGQIAGVTVAKRQWRRRYINMNGVYNSIHNEATSLLEHRGVEIPNPIQNFVAAFLLSSKSHDYIQCNAFAKGIGDEAIWRAYLNNPGQMATLVRVAQGEDRITGERTHFYVVDVDVARRLLRLACHEAAVCSNVKDKQKREETLKNKLAPKEITTMVAGQLAWTLHYWSAGATRQARIEDGLLTDEVTGLSIYGFDQEGWTSNIIQSDTKICPYIEL